MMYAPVMTSLNALTLEETVSHRSDTILFLMSYVLIITHLRTIYSLIMKYWKMGKAPA